MKRTKLSDRILPDYTKGEEIFNMVSHIAGAAIGIAAIVLCVVVAAVRNNVMGVVSGAIYGASMLILYTTSSIYHGLSPRLTAKKVFQILDHCSIFFLIAGTYTPIALSGIARLYPALGWTIFGIIWAAAVLGITLNSIDLKSFSKFSMICYIAMGWCIVAAYKQTFEVIGMNGFILLLAGGIAYTVGAAVYGIGKKRKLKFAHSVFHLLVIAASVFHLICILLYVI